MPNNGNMENAQHQPEWKQLVKADPARWSWRGTKLIANSHLSHPVGKARNALHQVVLEYFYADHNKSSSVRNATQRLVRELDKTPDAWGLNIGAGSTTFHARILNLDIFDGESINIVHDGGALPFHDKTLSLAICQEVLEHIDNFGLVVADIHRVLQPRGRFYVQVPFQIGYHSGPHDYWRFSHEGLTYLFNNDQWELEEIDISVGHGTGFYRIAVEFFAVTAAALSRHLYIPTKGLFALLLFPFKLADLVTRFSSEKHRIPGGYYVIARKRPDAT